MWADGIFARDAFAWMQTGEGFEIAATAPALVGMTIRFQPTQRCHVPGLVVAFIKDGFIRLKPECGQCGENGARGTGDFAPAVDILHAHDPFAAGCAGEQPSAKRGDHRAEMQASGG